MKCKATTKAGKPCRAWAVNGSDYCFQHDPARIDEQRAARSAGGKARHGRDIGSTGEASAVDLDGLDDATALLAIEINEMRQLERSVSRGNVIARLISVFLQSYERGEMQEQIDGIRQQLEALQNDRKTNG